jgi:hypothetical protein
LIATVNDQQDAAARAARTDAVIAGLSEIVCHLGPRLLTVGMTNLEANEAILACIEKLYRDAKEFKALATEEFDRLYEVLKFYGEKKNWQYSPYPDDTQGPAIQDGGARARAVLDLQG